MTDPECGLLTWNSDLDGWEGAITLPSAQSVELFIFSREDPDGRITSSARAALQRIVKTEPELRRYAARELVEIHNSEWCDGPPLREDQFGQQLIPESVEVHEGGYAEVHYQGEGLFDGHSIGVRIRENGELQEAVVEG